MSEGERMERKRFGETQTWKNSREVAVTALAACPVPFPLLHDCVEVGCQHKT